MKYLISFACMVAFSLQIGFSQPSGFTKLTSSNEVKEQMKSVSKNQKTIQSTFSQVKKMEYLDIAIQSSGNFWYSAPSQVRWEYTSPYDYTIIINNGKLSLISGDSQNDFDMENSEIFEQINSLMVGSVTGNIFDSPDYNIELFENSNQYLFMLNPQAEFMEGVITSIEMFLDKKSGIVTKIKMIEAEDNYSEITFSNTKINEPISEKIFIP